MAARAVLASLLLVTSVATLASAHGSSRMQESADLSETLTARLSEALPTDHLAIIVQYDSWEDRDRVAALGLPIAYTLSSIPAHFVWATPRQVHDLAAQRGVLYIEHNDPIEYDMNTAVVAGNVAPLWAAEQPNVTLDGVRIDGKGVTVAVVDTGVNAMHDDIKYGSKTVRNLMAITLPPDPTRGDPFTGAVLRFEDMENSDGGGHGSHVAGIVAGDGKTSGGKFRGSAPGASLVGIGSQAANFWYAVAAWDWIFQNHDKVNPNIRIITNSWGYATGVPCDPMISLTKIQKRLVLEAHITMFFSAGNTGGDGSRDMTRTQFKCPWEGNIGVGNYFDNNQGSRDWYQSNSSSRGKKDDPATWPDISGPGTQITAANGYPVQSTTNSYLLGCVGMRTVGQPAPACYATLSGTSMSTPFVAGVGALLLQARPDLKPADVEYILEQTALKFEKTYEDKDKATPYYADPALDYRHHGSHYFKGHGLVDAEAAVRLALNYTGEMSPVVYGEKEAPSKSAGRAKTLPTVAAQAEGTPGFVAFALVAALVLATWLSRRD